MIEFLSCVNLGIFFVKAIEVAIPGFNTTNTKQYMWQKDKVTVEKGYCCIRIYSLVGLHRQLDT